MQYLLEIAQRLDEEFSQGKRCGPLHVILLCITSFFSSPYSLTRRIARSLVPTRAPGSWIAGLLLADKPYWHMSQSESGKVTGLWIIQ